MTRPGWPLLLAIGLVSACSPHHQQVGSADDVVEFRYGEILFQRQAQVEVRVRLAFGSSRVTAERFAACLAAGAAQERGFVWGRRLRGARKIEGPLEDLAVLYAFSRFEEWKGEGTFTAALTKTVCEAEEIPTKPISPADARSVPNISLKGPEQPSTSPELLETGDAALGPIIPDGGSVDPEVGL